MVADERVIRDIRGPKLCIDSREDLGQDVEGVVVEAPDRGDMLGLAVVERPMMHVFPDHALAEIRVLLAVEHMRMPEGIERTRDRVGVTRIEERHRVVLLQREDPTLNVARRERGAGIHEVLANLPCDRVIIFRVDEGESARLLRMHYREKRRDNGPISHCKPPCFGFEATGCLSNIEDPPQGVLCQGASSALIFPLHPPDIFFLQFLQTEKGNPANKALGERLVVGKLNRTLSGPPCSKFFLKRLHRGGGGHEVERVLEPCVGKENPMERKYWHSPLQFFLRSRYYPFKNRSHFSQLLLPLFGETSYIFSDTFRFHTCNWSMMDRSA